MTEEWELNYCVVSVIGDLLLHFFFPHESTLLHFIIQVLVKTQQAMTQQVSMLHRVICDKWGKYEKVYMYCHVCCLDYFDSVSLNGNKSKTNKQIC